MKLLLDEMFPVDIAEQLRSLGHDVVCIHDDSYRHFEGAPDEEVFRLALTEGRALVTENVADFARLENEAIGNGEAAPIFVYTTNRQFPRGEPGTIGQLVQALDKYLTVATAGVRSSFLKRSAQ